jgi:dUTP pyrophosphatase
MTSPSLLFTFFVDSKDSELIDWYETKANEHNKHITEDPCPNSGFDLAVPEEAIIHPTVESSKLVTRVKGKMTKVETEQCVGYYMYPRSSISKTQLVLSNHVGIIDSGYRGPLTGMFRNLNTTDSHTMKKYDRYLQVCSSTLEPFLVKMVKLESELGTTNRGSGGFGSTGK